MITLCDSDCALWGVILMLLVELLEVDFGSFLEFCSSLPVGATAPLIKLVTSYCLQSIIELYRCYRTIVVPSAPAYGIG